LVLSRSDFAGDGTRLQSFRHGEAPEEEKELRILAPHTEEVYVIRKSPIRCNIAPAEDVLAILGIVEKQNKRRKSG